MSVIINTILSPKQIDKQPKSAEVSAKRVDMGSFTETSVEEVKKNEEIRKTFSKNAPNAHNPKVDNQNGQKPVEQLLSSKSGLQFEINQITKQFMNTDNLALTRLMSQLKPHLWVVSGIGLPKEPTVEEIRQALTKVIEIFAKMPETVGEAKPAVARLISQLNALKSSPLSIYRVALINISRNQAELIAKPDSLSLPPSILPVDIAAGTNSLSELKSDSLAKVLLFPKLLTANLPAEISSNLKLILNQLPPSKLASLRESAEISNILRSGLGKPLTQPAIRKLFFALGIDYEANVKNMLVKNDVGRYKSAPAAEKGIYQLIKVLTSRMANGNLKPENFIALKSAIAIKHSVFGNAKQTNLPSTIIDMLKPNLMKGLARNGIMPLGKTVDISLALLENGVTPNSGKLNDIMGTVKYFSTVDSPGDVVRYLTKSALLLKEHQIPVTPATMKYGDKILKALSNLNLSSAPFKAAFSPEAIRSMPIDAALKSLLNMTIHGKVPNRNPLNLVSLGNFFGIELPPEIKDIASDKSTANKALLNSILNLSAKIADSSNKKAGQKISLMRLAVLGKLVDSAAVSNKIEFSGLQNPYKIISNSYKIEPSEMNLKIAERLSQTNVELSPNNIESVKRQIVRKFGSSASVDKLLVIEAIGKAVKAISQKQVAQGRLAAVPDAMNRIGPEHISMVEQLALNLGSMPGMEGEVKGIDKILELMMAIARSGGSPELTKEATQYFLRSHKEFRTANDTNSLASHRPKETMKSELIELERSLEKSLNQRGKKMGGVLRAVSGILERLDALQAQNAAKENEISFILPFPTDTENSFAEFEYKKAESPNGEESLNVSISLAPEPIGPIKINVKMKANIITTVFELEREEYVQLIKEALPDFIRKLQNAGYTNCNVTCNLKAEIAVKHIRDEGLFI